MSAKGISKRPTSPKVNPPDEWAMRKPENYYNDDEKYIDKIESAWAKSALHFRTGLHFGHKKGSERCQGLVSIHTKLEVYRVRYESGIDTLALLHAVSVCAEENLPLPTWLALAYGEKFHGFLSLAGETSLDKIFYSPNLPTGTAKKTASARQDWEMGAKIWRAIWNLVLADASITSLDKAIDKVLENSKFGIKKTKAKQLFSMVEKNQIELVGGQYISREFDKRRKG